MAGTLTMAKKEFLDIIGEKKFILIFATLLIVVLVSTFQGGLTYSSSQSSVGITPGQGGNFTRQPGEFVIGGAQSLSLALSSMDTNFSLVGGVLAIAISFDTINSERQRGSLSTLLSYPIYRDSIIYGKYLGGLMIVSLVSVITFLSGVVVFVSVTGLAMTFDTVIRLLLFFGVSFIYMAFFLAVGLLLSILLKQPSTSLLASMIVWLASIQLIPNLGYAIGQILFPIRMSFTNGRPNFTMQTGFESLRTIIAGLSPSQTYENIVNTFLTTSTMQFSSGSTPTVVSINIQQALMQSLPSLIYFVGLLIAIFAVAYVVFTRQEIR